MTLTYSLDQNDFLQSQLFMASKSERIKSQRLKSWLIVSGSMLLLAYMFYQSNNMFLFYYFIVLGIITLVLYPFYQRLYYKRHYNKYLADNYKKRFGQIATISFSEFAIETADIAGESKINLSELESVTETNDYFYPKLKTGENIIIPKAKIQDVIELKNELKQLCTRLNIPFTEDLSWKWK